MVINNQALALDLEFVLDHTREDWEALRGERIFMTGATGFFGCWLLETFLHANNRLNLGAKAAILTRNQDAFFKKAPHLAHHPALSFIRGDVRHFRFPDGSFSHLIHAATEASAKLNNEQPELMKAVICEGTEHTLEFAQRAGVKRLLLTSSGAVYGKQPPELSHVREQDLEALLGREDFQSHSAYGEAKLAAEDYCVDLATKCGIEVKLARCFAFVGPYLPLDIHFAIGNFILAGLMGKRIEINGDGTPLRSYLYAADLMIWLWRILFRGVHARPYNVGSEEAISIESLARRVVAQFDHPPAISIAKPKALGELPSRYIPSTQRAQEELGLAQFVDLDQAVSRTKRWYELKLR